MTHVHIRPISASEMHGHLDALVDLLREAVHGGASLGFLAPLPRDTARDYWLSLRPELERGARFLLGAYVHGRLVGSGQLAPSPWPNSPHRAEVQKLLVEASARGLGIGQQLMHALHDAATRHGRSMIVLHTRSGGAPEAFYRRLGYRVAGVLPGSVVGAGGQRHDIATLYLEMPC